VLLDLQGFAKLPDLSVRNSAYATLGFAAIGETFIAREVYDSGIAPHIQQLAPYYRVGTGSDRAGILDATSAAALAAARLGMPEAMGLHEYVVAHRYDGYNRLDPHRSDEFLQMNVERLLFISHDIANRSGSEASITYTLFGETFTRDLGRGGQYTLRIPAQSMNEFTLLSVTGEVGAVSVVRTPLEDLEPIDADITIRREFFKAGSNVGATTFEQGDLVRVSITVDYSRRAVGGSYIITDFLPAGLAYTAQSARIGNHTGGPAGWQAFAASEGQRVTFYDYNGFNRINTYYYYARVINPGTFKAEGTLVQSIGAREYMTVGADAVLTIRH